MPATKSLDAARIKLSLQKIPSRLHQQCGMRVSCRAGGHWELVLGFSDVSTSGLQLLH